MPSTGEVEEDFAGLGGVAGDVEGVEGGGDGVVVGDDRADVQGAVGEGGDDFVDFVVEPERAFEIQFPGDGQGDQDRLRAGGQQPDHDHGPAPRRALDRGGQAVVVPGGLDHDVGLDPGDRLTVGGGQDLVRAD